MTCEELRGEYGAWALGIAEDPARSEIVAHLARECPDCLAGVRGAMATVTAMSGAVSEIDPPRRLRQRILGMVAPERKRTFVYLPWAVSALLAIALLSVVIPGRPENQSAAKLAQALTIMNDPVAKEVTFGDPAARGRVFVSSKGVVLIAAHLPKLDPGHTFELWVIPAAGNPVPAGIFRGETISNSSVASGAVYVYRGPTANASVIAVTVEPEGGSPQPTTTPFIVSKL
jgi:anti-sigma-K factor RskA